LPISEVQAGAVEEHGQPTAVLHHRADRVGRTSSLEDRRGQQERDEEPGDVVQHDRHDDLVSTGARFEHTDDAAPQGTAHETGEDAEHEVDPDRQVHAEPDVPGEDRTDDDLALATDVEQPRPEGEPEAEPGGDQWRGVGQGLGERAQRPADGVLAEVDDRAGEQRRVGVTDRLPCRGQRVAGAAEEVSGALLHLGVGHRDQHGPDRQRQDDRQERHHRAAGGQFSDEALRPRLRGRRLARSLRGHRCLPAFTHVTAPLPDSPPSRLSMTVGCAFASRSAFSGAIPAIISPSASRSVSPGTMPTMEPRYMTTMRSAKALISSSSVDTMSTGTPWSRSWTMRRCTNSIDPTSSPRVGWAATNSLSGRDSSRATTTFC